MSGSIALAFGTPNKFIPAEQTPSLTLRAKDTHPPCCYRTCQMKDKWNGKVEKAPAVKPDEAIGRPSLSPQSLHQRLSARFLVRENCLKANKMQDADAGGRGDADFAGLRTRFAAP